MWVVSHNSQVQRKHLILLLLAGLGIYLYLEPEALKDLQRRGEDALTTSEPGGSASEPAQTIAPDLVPGSHLEFDLKFNPQTSYLAATRADAGDQEFRQRLAAVAGKQVHYDPWLSRAAQELAFQGALLSDSPPQSALSFILRSAGAPESSVAQLVVRANGDGGEVIDEAIVSALKNAPTGPGELVLGIGEAATDGDKYSRRVVVVVARRNFDIDPTPRSVERDGHWVISGQAPAGFHDAHASVLYPNHEMSEIPIALDQGRFSLRVPTGSQEGALRVSIDGAGGQGPFKLLQLVAQVGRPVPTHFEDFVPSAEDFPSDADAEAHAFALLNRDRASLSLPPLLWDGELSALARAHSQDMQEQGFFAHLSPTTGLAKDRLEQAGYRASAHGENLALNESIAESEASLLESVGHRRNIVSDTMTHVGIGVSRGVSEGSWHLTQLFARKVLPFDADTARVDLLARINKRREQDDALSLTLSEPLAELATEGCHDALNTPIEQLPQLLAPRASQIAGTRVAVSVPVFYDLATLEPETDSGFDRAGLAFLRDPDDLHGRTFLVLILAEQDT